MDQANESVPSSEELERLFPDAKTREVVEAALAGTLPADKLKALGVAAVEIAGAMETVCGYVVFLTSRLKDVEMHLANTGWSWPEESVRDAAEWADLFASGIEAVENAPQ